MVKTPVLFETFVRVDYARQVWDAIKEAQPNKLYFYSNKGRAEKVGEIESNNEIRSWIKEIDWDCELHTWFREECVDVYTSLRSAASWVFEHEESAVILEDDIIPSRAFFSFVDQMLEKYKHNQRIWYISGDNFCNLNPSGKDYIFSSYRCMHGWATWKNKWELIDWDNLLIDEMIAEGVPYHLYKTKKQAKSRIKQLRIVKPFVEETKCWDYVFGIVCDQHNGIGIIPTHHLITNIGLMGEHHDDNEKTIVNIKCEDMNYDYLILNEPLFVQPDYEFDYQFWKLRHIQLWKRIINKLKRIF